MGSNLKSDISNRILETRKQTEELKAQLQNLIDSGINSSLEYNRASDNSHVNEDKTRQESLNKVQIIKSYDTKHSEHANKPSTIKTVQSTKLRKEDDEPAKQESPKKVRSYNVVEAREYIKKQREKRIEQLKTQNADQIKADLKKKKLEELHKRSQELVTKNIQAKRERSKSRDRNDLRFDKEKRNPNLLYPPQPNYVINQQKRKDSKIHKEEQQDKVNVQAKRERSKSGDKVNRNNLKSDMVEERDPNLLYPPKPEYMLNERSVRSEKIEKKERIQKTNENKFKQTEKPGSLTNEQKWKDDNVQKEGQLDKVNSNDDFLTVNSNIKIITGNSSERTSSKSDHKAFKNTLRPVNLFGLEHSKSEQILQTDNKEIAPVNNILEYKRSSENVIFRSPREQNLVTPKNYKLKSTLSEVGIGTDNLEKYTKETQTAQEKIEFPLWLQENQPPGDPFNFINTVKRKLEDVVKLSKPSVEVGVQSSLIQESSNTKTPANTKSKKEIMEMLQQSTKSTKKSELNSFISHKCVNLNSKTIDHLELIPKDFKTAGQTYTSKFTETESESDTSKNIPEISSESVTSLKNRVESVKDNGFDMEKINKMTLVPHAVKSNTTTIHSEVEKISSERLERKSKKGNQKHTSKLLESDLSKSRESIISFNSPNYDKQIHSTSKTHKTTDLSNAKSSSFLDQHSSNIPEKDTKNSIQTTYSMDVLSPNYDTQLHSSSKSRKATDLSNVKSLLLLDKHSSDIPDKNANSNIQTTHSTGASSSVYDTELHSSSKRHKPKDLSNVKGLVFLDKLSSNIPERNMNSSIQTTDSMNVLSKSRQSVISANGPTYNKSMAHSSEVKSDAQTILTVSEKSSASSIHSRSKENDIPSSSNKKTEVSQKTSKISSEKYTTLFSDGYSRSDTSLQYVNTSRGSGSFSDNKPTCALPLKEPSLKLMVSKKGSEENEVKKRAKNVSVRSNKAGFQGDMNKTNEIHLKFEAEIHLLNDFNESLRKFSAAEKTMESLKLKDEIPPKVLGQQDVQTSLNPLSENKTLGNDVPDTAKSEISSINYSRGSMFNDLSGINIDNSSSKLDTSMSVSNLDRSNSSVPKSNLDLSNFENLQANNYAGMSLRMFEHLIKDEDARLENLKTILKIRERALLDRTKGELAWLEIQRKHLRETGQIHEASLIKKKQRGILMNHQKEKHEMQRLKQMQKAASIERKIILKEQRNLIKHQLSTDNMLSKIKVNTPRERRLSGPLKVIQSHTESIRSETSISKKSSSEREQEVYSVTSHTHSIVSRVSEVSGDDVPKKNLQPDVESIDFTKKIANEASWAPLSQMKMTLLLREAALQKRRKAAEELLQWHKKLLEEEKRITELESTASAIISQIPNSVLTPPDVPEKYKFKGKQLNQLWYNLTGSRDNKFAEEKIYPMSQLALDRFCKNAREYSSKSKKILRKFSNSEISDSNDGASENIPEQNDNLSVRSKNKEVPSATVNDYTSDFDVESIQEIVHSDGMDVVDQSINELIDNFSKIKDDISSLSIKQSLISTEQKGSRSDRTISSSDASVVETEQKLQTKEKSSKEETDTSKEERLKETSKLTEEISSPKSSTEIPSNAETSDKTSPIETSTLEDQQSVIRSKTEEILSQLEDKLNTHIPSTNSHSTEENSEHILDNSSQLKEKLNTELFSDNTLVEDSQISRDVSRSISKTQEILKKLSQLDENQSSEDKNGRTEIDVESVLDESQISNETKDNLNKSEEILLRLSEIDVSSKMTPGEDTSIQKASSDSVASLQADLSKSEEILSKLSTKPSVSEVINKSDDASEPSKLSQMEESSSQKSVAEEETATSTDSKIESVSSEELSSRRSQSEEQSVIEALENDVGSSRSSPEEEIVVADTQKEESSSVEGGSEDLKPERQEIVKEISGEPSEKDSATESVKETITSEDFIDEELKSEETSEVQPPSDVAGVNEGETKVENEEVISENLCLEKKLDKNTEDEEIKLEDKNLETTEEKTIEDEVASIEKSKTKSEQTDSTPDISENETSSKIEENSKTATEDTHTSVKENQTPLSKEDINSFEEKEQDSLSSSTVSGSHSVATIETVSEKSKGSVSGEKSPKSGTVDVKKRVSEILADANHSPRGDRSPRLQDLYVTTYDLVSPANSPELGSPTEEQRIVTAKSIFGTEAEEILRKQLAIEQEIKQITEQQQKEQQLPYMFVREIPNKPPPPYTPPSSLPPGPSTIVPTTEDIEEITKYSAKILHKAYLSNNLDNISISENTLGLISKNVSTDCYKFGFDLCKEIAKQHYKQFEREKCPSWLQVSKKPQLAIVRPLDVNGLEKYMSKKLKELFGYKKIDRRENTIIKWSRKKRDHVDEILVMESQAEELQWTNYDKDELLVIDEVTNEIMNTLLKESGEIFSEILSKRTYLY